MSFGFRVRNKTNILQIDSNFANYGVYSTGTIPGGGITSTITKPNSEARLLLENKIGCSYTLANTGGTENWLVTNDEATIDYVIVVPSYVGLPNTNPGRWGMTIRKPDGQIAYSTRHTYPNIGANFNFPVTTNYADISKKVYIDITSLFFAGDWTIFYENGNINGFYFLYVVCGLPTFSIFTNAYQITQDQASNGGSGWFVNSTRYFNVLEL
jgi:hypothetical protein